MEPPKPPITLEPTSRGDLRAQGRLGPAIVRKADLVDVRRRVVIQKAR